MNGGAVDVLLKRVSIDSPQMSNLKGFEFLSPDELDDGLWLHAVSQGDLSH
jgi:hypothetical protein